MPLKQINPFFVRVTRKSKSILFLQLKSLWILTAIRRRYLCWTANSWR